MRILAFFIIVFLLASFTLVMIKLFSYVGSKADEAVNTAIENVSRECNVTVNMSEIDIMDDLKPYIEVLNGALIVIFIILIAAGFIYMRKRA